MMISAAQANTNADAMLPLHFRFIRIAADNASADARKAASRAVGGDGTRMEEDGTSANQWVDAASIPIRKLRICPRMIPRPLHIALIANDTNPNGTITPVSSTAGMFAIGAMKDTRWKSRASNGSIPI